MSLSEQERITLLMIRSFGDRIRSYNKVCELFNATFNNHKPITKNCVKKIQWFQETGSITE